jgi:hypothetical protein
MNNKHHRQLTSHSEPTDTMDNPNKLRCHDYGQIGKEFFATVLPISQEAAAEMLDKEIDVLATNTDAKALCILKSFIPVKLKDIEDIMEIRYEKYAEPFRVAYEMWCKSGVFPGSVGNYEEFKILWPVPDAHQWAWKCMKFVHGNPDTIVILLIFNTIQYAKH